MQRHVFFVLLLVFCSVVTVDAASSPSVQKEDYPRTIRVGVDANWPPFDYYDSDLKHQGIASDYLDHVAKDLGLEIEYVPGDWHDVLNMAKDGEVDMLACAARTEQRTAYLHFTQPYIYIDSAVFVRKTDETIQRLADLAGKTVALPRGNFLHDYFVSHYPQVNLVLTRSNEEALELVALGKVDAHIGNLAVGNYFLGKNILTNVQVAFKVDALENGFCFAVSKQRPALYTALQQALSRIDDKTHRQIRQRWVDYFSNQEDETLGLTPQQRQWILEHPRVRVGTGSTWPPYDFREEGQYRGLARDYLDLIHKKTGLTFDYSFTDTWESLQLSLSNEQIDLLPAIYQHNAAQSPFLFTTPYIQAREFLFIRDDHQGIDVLDDIRHHRAVMVKGSGTTPQIRHNYPSVTILEVDTISQALDALMDDRADFYIDTYSAVNFVANKNHFVGIRAAFAVDLVNTQLSMAVSRQQPQLLAILQAALDDISTVQRQQIEQRWLTANDPQRQKVQLTAAERDWLKQHPVVTFSGDPQRAPTTFYDAKGVYSGVIADYLEQISQRTGLQFEARRQRDLVTALHLFQEHQVDLIDVVGYSPSRFEQMDFSSEHIRVDHVIVVRQSARQFRRITELSQYNVGVVDGNVVGEKILKDVPEALLSRFSNALTGLKALSRGEIDAFIVDLPTFDYDSERAGLSNLKVSGATPYSYALYFGIQKDLPELRSIINKALQSIDANERREIYRRWIAFEYEADIDYRLLWQSAAIFLVIIAATLWWNRRLKAEVERRRQAEAALLVAKEAAEQATKAKSVFLAHMSHDIRTPLNSVIGFTDILDTLIKDPVQKGYLRSIKIGGKALLGIINDILDLSKIEAGQMVLHRENVNPHQLFRDMEQLFHEQIRHKNLNFVVDVDEALPQSLLVDAVRLRQILLNLIGNAIKFTEQGYVTLRVQKIFRDAQCSKLDLQIDVEDSGMGISPDDHESIFQMFQQSKGQDERRFGGSGLGLAICQKLVTMMDGEIHVASELGQGSTFSVILHNIDVGTMLPVNTELAETHFIFEPATVMIVDDVTDNRQLIQAVFRDTAIRVVEAENGVEALERLTEIPIDLVLMDLRMPVLGGEETAERMRHSEVWQQLPIIALTASVLETELKQLKQRGFDGYLRKPIERVDLLRAVARFLPAQSIDTSADEREQPRCRFSSVEHKRQLEQQMQGFNHEVMQIREQGDLSLFDSFVEQLMQLNATYELELLTEYCTRLRQAIEGIDLKEVYGLLGDFPQLVEAVRNGEVDDDDQ
ncbi:transporter substrate-binding domain-containing protein [Desulfuromonas acetoxidans]|uniref:histidine kinase n=1 Tax=Desulfuromonas acetoxidans (strain DSM 684 / 11070) TaxID=281689 RepID=Q1JWA5_DESA6|nr:transporter substrate-binding domain-containing protein [Desulfuromonas acetoxidans]EAT14516.1 histidine kinase [Desulfuromonas acetoxidans DSM 684]MBF0645268.1 transporter substrate-binding domain-containing protein [Desulfuromonas acetoxidans]NVD25574.1 transporter substrate-binding domain-containing protein [Desulfuromonas acetoxidans]NVE17616.1 transporter substrate-binding domain-containing protein [Desulfuromonas acetoxidans]